MRGFLRSEMGEPLPLLAMDSMPRARLGGAAGGARDQDPDNNNITIANSPAHAALLKLTQFLADRLSPEDVQEATGMIQDLFGSTDDDNGNGGGGGSGMAGDRRPGGSASYAARFPNHNRLYKKTYG